MSDEPAVQGVTQEAPATPAKAGGIKAFFGTTLGKIILIGGAVAALLTVLAVVGVILLGGFLFQQVSELPPGSVVTTQTAGSQPTSSTVVAAVPVIENSEVFTPRNPFEPVVVPASATATEGTGASGDDNDENTLTLMDIIEENGVRKAVLKLGATTYTVGAGEQLGSTPWQVVKVGTSSVTMLYGDSQIVLTVGQGIQTK